MLSLVRLSYSDSAGFNECGSSGEYVNMYGFQLLVLNPDELRFLQSIDDPKIQTVDDASGAGDDRYATVEVTVLTDSSKDPVAIEAYQKLTTYGKLQSENIHQKLLQLIDEEILQLKPITLTPKILHVLLPPVEELRERYKYLRNEDLEPEDQEPEEDYTNRCINWYQFQKLMESVQPIVDPDGYDPDKTVAGCPIDDFFNDDWTHITISISNTQDVSISLLTIENKCICDTVLKYTNILEIRISPRRSSYNAETIYMYLSDSQWIPEILNVIKKLPPPPHKGITGPWTYLIDNPKMQRILRKFPNTTNNPLTPH